MAKDRLDTIEWTPFILLPHFTQVFVECYGTNNICSIYFTILALDRLWSQERLPEQCPLNMTAPNKPHLVQIMETSKSVQACQLFWRVIFAECKKLFTVTQATHSIPGFSMKTFHTIVWTFNWKKTPSESEVLLVLASRYSITLTQCSLTKQSPISAFPMSIPF